MIKARFWVYLTPCARWCITGRLYHQNILGTCKGQAWGRATLLCFAGSKWKHMNHGKQEVTQRLRREALISSFKTKEWPREFGQWILVERVYASTLCSKEQVGEEPRQLRQQGPQAGRPSPVGLASFCGPRRTSSSCKPLTHFQVHAPKFIVQRPYEPLRKIHVSLPSLKIPKNLLQFLSLYVLFVHFSTNEKPLGELFVNLCSEARWKRPWTLSLEEEYHHRWMCHLALCGDTLFSSPREAWRSTWHRWGATHCTLEAWGVHEACPCGTNRNGTRRSHPFDLDT
jgi:hypothetical protein